MSDNKVAIHLVMEGAAKAEGDAHKFSASIRSIGQEAEKVQKSASSFRSLAADISHVGSSAFIAVQGFKAMTAPVADVARALIQARVAADQMRQSMSEVFGDKYIANMDFARGVADKFGASIVDVSRAYSSFAASTNGTALAGEETRKIFEAVAGAAGRMGLASEQVNRAFLAISQMAGKGVISMEELRGQLGEAMPGAVQAMARALGVSVAELGKLAEQGKLNAEEVLPKFRAELEKIGGSGGAIHTAQAELTRLANAWLEMKRALGDTGAADAGISVLQGLTIAIKDATAAMDEARKRDWGFLGQMFAGVGGFAYGNPSQEAQRRQIKREIVETEQFVRELQAKSARNGGYLPIADRAEMNRAQQALAGLQEQLRGMAETTGKIALPNLKEQADQNAITMKQGVDAALKAWDTDKLATKAEETANKLAELGQRYADTYSKALSGGADQTALDNIVADYGKRAAELQKGDTTAARQAATEAAQVMKEQYDNRAKLIDAALKHEQSLLKQAVTAGTWASQTGALSKPASVLHAGQFWLLLNSLADVTASEPGVTADWQLLVTIPDPTGNDGLMLLADAGAVSWGMPAGVSLYLNDQYGGF